MGLFVPPSIPDGIANGLTGFGDGVYHIVTLGMGNLNEVRNAMGINGGVNMCSDAYAAGKYLGYAWGLGMGWAAGLNGGASSVFWSGAGNMERAAQIGTNLESTPIGYLLNLGGERTPYWLWKAASGTFSLNADGTAIKVGVEEGNIWLKIEQPILSWRNIPIQRVP